ncbi:MerR family DNA-binding transcriptional regulator [Streptomyces sp. NPDC057242]
MKIGEASRVGEVSPRSLRHYAHEGLIVPERPDRRAARPT